MYTRYIDVKNKTLSFANQIDFVIDVSEFPHDVIFYVEEDGDWWVEKDPFKGRHKDEKVRLLALELFKQFENNEQVLEVQKDFKVYYSEYDKFYLRKKADQILTQFEEIVKKLDTIEKDENLNTQKVKASELK